jgi:3-hydroxybutyryl-CoA dehydrogenase
MISLRIIAMIINEAYLVLQEGTSNRKDIDTAMKLGTNYPYGPIEWSEKLGIELVYNILKSMFDEYGDDRYRITPLLKEKYLEGLI